jgi:hypothetical protein
MNIASGAAEVRRGGEDRIGGQVASEVVHIALEGALLSICQTDEACVVQYEKHHKRFEMIQIALDHSFSVFFISFSLFLYRCLI